MNTNLFENKLQKLDEQGLKRELREVRSPQGRAIIIDGKKAINFCSNDYLGLANHPQLKEAFIKSAEQWGVGSGASRLVCGNMFPHQELETRLATLKGAESCLVFSSGYMANIGIIPTLVGRHDIILADRLNHACLVDGAQLSRATLKRYGHNDMNALEQALVEAQSFEKRLIVTDSVFSMDGDQAPLKDIVALAEKYEAFVMVDEAHAFGVFGRNGGGLVQELGLEDDIDIQMGTLSKAAGCFGGYVCGSQDLIEYLMNHARSFIYTTGMPPAVAAAAVEAVDYMRDADQSRSDVLKKADYLRAQLHQCGFDTMNSTTQIVPILIGDAAQSVKISEALLTDGIFVQAIRPPTVPKNTARLRITVTASHTQQDIDDLIQAVERIGR